MDYIVLNPDQTAEVMKRERPTGALVNALVPLKDTGESIFVTGMTEPALAALRGNLKRRGVKITVKSVARGDTRGHVILPTSI